MKPEPTPAQNNQANAGLGKTDTFVETEQPIEPRTPDEVRSAYTANQVGVKWCFEQALKKDPTLRISRIDVTITISAQGVVSSVIMPNRGTPLSDCLTDRIRRWKFRKATEELTTQFPLIFQRG
ncbi:MAG: AgmX/PglI C-terminal domain-containing protein [Deltaproteobacteria bacterium]|nr:AgmX/PglI C-terminal domain-containing protein [Deltaproteobacteria bacterium]